MALALSEAQCLAGFLALTGGGYASLVASKGDGHSPPRLYVFREVAAAGCTTAWVSCLFNWTDVVKVRMQVPGGSKLYPSFASSTRRILGEEGMLGLFLPGIVASGLRDVSYSGLSIGLYPFMKASLFGSEKGEDVGFARKFVTGMVTGALFSGFVNPADLVKIRVQAEAGKVGEAGILVTGLRAGHPAAWQNSLGAFVAVSRAGGVAGLFRGSTATMLRAACGRGAQLSCYDHSKFLLKRYAGMREGICLHMLGSFLSGLAFATAAAPADLVKTRLMSGVGKYRGLSDCFRHVLVTEGGRAFFRGWTASAARLAPHFTIVGVCMEQARLRVGVGYFAA